MILIQPSINPIIVSLGFIDIRWYSLAYIFAFIFGSILIKKINKSSYNLLSDSNLIIAFAIFLDDSKLTISPAPSKKYRTGGKSVATTTHPEAIYSNNLVGVLYWHNATSLKVNPLLVIN